jgi:hypothetical protein
LHVWAEWCARGRKITGLGYPGQSAFMNLTRSGGGRLLNPAIDEACWRTEQAIHAVLNADLQRTVQEFYLHAGTAATHAKALRCSRETLYLRLHRAHVAIDSFLHDGSAGTPSQL